MGVMKAIGFQVVVTLLASTFFVGVVNAESVNPSKKIEAVPGEFVIQLKDSPMAADVNTLANMLGGRIKDRIPSDRILVIKRADVGTPLQVAKKIAELDFVEKAEPNYIYRINTTPNDPDFSKLWGLKNTGQTIAGDENQTLAGPGVAGIDIGAEQAWDITTGSDKVLVAVIDTGVDYTHPDLKDNAWVNEAELNGKPGVDDDNNGVIDDIHGYNAIKNSGDPKDDHGHGTHCSGTIGGNGNNALGVAGVNWNVRIMGAKFLSADGSGSLSDAVKAIDYAVKMGAKVLSNSWGGGGYSEVLKSAIERSNKANAIFVAAAGNETNDNDKSPSYPASYQVENVISVAAIDNRGQLASFSNWGKKLVHVAAPGVNIYSTVINGKYEKMSGTSMATPHVAGVAALVLSKEPNLTGAEMRARLISTSRPLAGVKNKVVSNGLVNAYNALTNQQAPPDENDPTNWVNKRDISVSSPHPYPAKANLAYEVSQPGAAMMALYFDKFETEYSWDKATFYDKSGNIITNLSGSQSGSWSQVFNGDYVKIVFTSDGSVNQYGFDITKIAWKNPKGVETVGSL